MNYSIRRLLSLTCVTCLLTLGCEDMDGYTPVSFIVEGDKAIMSGVIDSDIISHVRELYENHSDVTTIVMQEVPGSIDDEANLTAARLVRSYGLNTVVPTDGFIASGGVDFFLAGVERTIEPGAKLGVHSWGGDGFTGDELPRDDPEHNRYLAYYSEMGIPTEFYWFTLEAAPVEDFHVMTPAEIDQYKITTQ